MWQSIIWDNSKQTRPSSELCLPAFATVYRVYGYLICEARHTVLITSKACFRYVLG